MCDISVCVCVLAHICLRMLSDIRADTVFIYIYVYIDICIYIYILNMCVCACVGVRGSNVSNYKPNNG